MGHPPVKSVADFLMYLFQDRKLQPSTIDGYRSAIADRLGNLPINISKDQNLSLTLSLNVTAWQNRNIRHQSDWSRVSLYPSPSFLSKNQLAKEGPDSVAAGVITALAPTLDRSLKSDRSLCPVRALRYYLDRTSGRMRRWFLSPLRRFRQRHLTCHYLLLDQAHCDPML